jgi:predicted transcriptional regulator
MEGYEMILMVLRYRSRVEIIYRILEIAQTGETKTKIMYKAFLSYAKIKHYISTLTEAGLLQYDASNDVYRATYRGVQFLKTYEQLMHLISDSPLTNAA